MYLSKYKAKFVEEFDDTSANAQQIIFENGSCYLSEKCLLFFLICYKKMAALA